MRQSHGTRGWDEARHGHPAPPLCHHCHSSARLAFVGVLCAYRAPHPLREAARVARHHILVIEDLDVPNHTMIAHRNLVHDPNGIFRTLDEWLRMIRSTAGVSNVWQDSEIRQEASRMESAVT